MRPTARPQLRVATGRDGDCVLSRVGWALRDCGHSMQINENGIRDFHLFSANPVASAKIESTAF